MKRLTFRRKGLRKTFTKKGNFIGWLLSDHKQVKKFHKLSVLKKKK